MGERSLSFCNVVAIWSETLLYGIYVTLSVITVRFLSLRLFLDRHEPSLHQTYLAAIFLLFIFATIHVAAGLAMVIEAFVLAPNISSDVYFAKANGPLNSLRMVAFLGNIVIADVVMIHRAYLLWDRSVVITLVPLFNLLLVVISGIFILVLSSAQKSASFVSSSPIQLSASLPSSLRILNPLHIGLSFTTNLFITILAGVSVFRKCPECNGGYSSGAPWPWKFLVFAAKTGFLYPLVSLVSLLLTVVQANSQVIPYALLSQIAAILPNLMILVVTDGHFPCSPIDSSSKKPHFRRRGPTSVEKKLPFFDFSPREGIRERPDSKATPSASSPLPSTDPPNIRLPPLPQTPPPVPQASKKRRPKEPPSPLVFPSQSEPSSPPPAPNTPEPRHQLPSPYETHFPRDKGRHARFSQQTFNSKRTSAGQGRAVVTEFGNSGFARKLALVKEGEFLAPPSPQTAENARKKALKKREPDKTTTVSNQDLPSGIHMLKAVERRIDYLDETPSK